MTQTIHTFNGETQEIEERKMTQSEIADLLVYQTEAQKNKAERDAERADIKATKIAAYQKMGLTQKEIDALMPPEPEPLPLPKSIK